MLKKIYLIISFLFITSAIVGISKAADTTSYSQTQITKANAYLKQIDKAISKKNLDKIKTYKLLLPKLENIAKSKKEYKFLMRLMNDFVNNHNNEVSNCKKTKHLGEEQTTSSYIHSDTEPAVHLSSDREEPSYTGGIITVNEGEIVNMKAVIDFIDKNEYPTRDGKKLKPHATFFWSDDGVGDNFCQSTDLQKVVWKAPKVDNDLIVYISVKMMDNADNIASAAYPIRVINSDKSISKGFSIKKIGFDKEEQIFSMTKLNIELDAPQKIEKIELDTRIPDEYETCCGYKHGWGTGTLSTLNTYYLENIYDNRYSLSIPTSDYSMYPKLDFKIRLYDDNNNLAEAIASGVTLIQGSYEIYLDGTLKDDLKDAAGWTCVRESGSNKDISCRTKYPGEYSLKTSVDRSYQGKNLIVYFVKPQDGLKGVSFDTIRQKILTKLSFQELTKLGVAYGPFKVKNGVIGGAFKFEK